MFRRDLAEAFLAIDPPLHNQRQPMDDTPLVAAVNENTFSSQSRTPIAAPLPSIDPNAGRHRDTYGIPYSHNPN